MNVKLSHLLLAGAVLVTAAAFTPDGSKKGPTGPPAKFIDPANMDLSIKPGDDFFDYANGTWIKDNAIPAKETRWGSFNILHQQNTDKLLSLLAEVSKTPGQPKGSLKQRVGDLYASGMDSLSIEKKGYDPIKPDLARIAKISDLSGVIDEMIYERVSGDASPLFGAGVGADSKHPTRNIVSLRQGGTSLPDRDYYLKDNDRNKKIRDAYKKYIVTLFTLTGTSADEADKDAVIILNIETALAKAQLSRVEMRDPNKTYNKFSVADLNKTTPHLNWSQLLPMMKMNGVDTVIVGQPGFFKVADDMLASTPVADWKVYLEWNMLKGSASELSSPFVKANFEFSSTLSGQKVQTPRNERTSGLVDGSLGELLGQLYVEKYFTPAAKEYMVNLVNNLKSVLGDRIKRLDWMSAETKEHALKKLNAFTVKIGYPDKWQNYDGLVIDRNDYYGNLKRISKWRYNYNIAQLGKPVDKKRWGMTPPTVNAYYNPVNNEIVFPAGILQFPFFDFKADDAVNYGGIGAVIGHEMTHGFDDQGRQYDADGSLHEWWTKDDADKFKSRADQVVAQYNAFTVVDTLHVNGKLTLGENLADLGGLNIAYEAFKKTKEGQSGKKIDGFTPDQRFFLSWAQVWRGSQRPEAAAQRILTDPHSPEKYRCNAPISNIDAWYAAFNIQPGDKNYKKPEDRIRVW
ncbi:M13 family metallopeptidase [Mucilaginibacter ginsenosidivorans]|uniref:M13 family metallopeptidase n=1 Tax=Mucilaginibacter ginsenosidivorans TaxID=398053 RepID=A0A5B8V0D5_9SPHI|nr:M13 family metallopeptidase [Mucilaginibacter ginsenosidivorans]QEC64967.1 M13 family metallopeptidase [Mucilaginibacter ginsenosidivorans]